MVKAWLVNKIVFGSGALSDKMLLVMIVENDELMFNLGQVRFI